MRTIRFQSFFYNLKGFSFCLAIVLLMSACHTQKKIVKEETGKKSETKKIQGTYASLLNVDQKRISNIKLYSFIDEWYGIPYRYGEKSKKGIDCSNFVIVLYEYVYKKNISGPAASLYKQCKNVSKYDLREGDLVFFKIDSDNISHIGVYLQNNKFVHSSTKKGVIINDLDEEYYKKFFYKGGKLQ